MTCPHCGAVFDDALAACPFCGSENVPLSAELHESRVGALKERQRTMRRRLPELLVRSTSSALGRTLLWALAAVAALLLALGGWSLIRRAVQAGEAKRMQQLYESGSYAELYSYMTDHDIYGGSYSKYWDVASLQGRADDLAELLAFFAETDYALLPAASRTQDIAYLLRSWQGFCQQYTDSLHGGVVGNEEILAAIRASARDALAGALPVRAEELDAIASGGNADADALAETVAERMN